MSQISVHSLFNLHLSPHGNKQVRKLDQKSQTLFAWIVSAPDPLDMASPYCALVPVLFRTQQTVLIQPNAVILCRPMTALHRTRKRHTSPRSD
ncbi:hypothetical protein H257_03889 [Aphanomyces astaci]|uniref:Uncharacterized protein n=1 Tax=Aphanomyces astaci TaxID=112090 RepID=W4H0V5_APHAT|nr:hypothetical protein H257_03889 [Aphanomyces astaci]ETV84798.1 hypothetical protein H257_03889 [Aphanomyces astaci]|eukprot:XP_009826490.1 hypothetical protein H257_03889 [Aphanomyces astaci]